MFAEALRLNRLYMAQDGGGVAMTSAGRGADATPLIPTPVEAQAHNLLLPPAAAGSGALPELRSPVGAQHVTPALPGGAVTTPQSPTPITVLQQAQQMAPPPAVSTATIPAAVLQAAAPQTQQVQLQKLTLTTTTPLQLGSLGNITLPTTTSNVTLPPGFALCQLNGKSAAPTRFFHSLVLKTLKVNNLQLINCRDIENVQNKHNFD